MYLLRAKPLLCKRFPALIRSAPLCHLWRHKTSSATQRTFCDKTCVLCNDAFATLVTPLRSVTKHTLLCKSPIITKQHLLLKKVYIIIHPTLAPVRFAHFSPRPRSAPPPRALINQILTDYYYHTLIPLLLTCAHLYALCGRSCGRQSSRKIAAICTHSAGSIFIFHLFPFYIAYICFRGDTSSLRCLRSLCVRLCGE